MENRKKDTHCSDKTVFKIWKPDMSHWGEKPQGHYKMGIILSWSPLRDIV